MKLRYKKLDKFLEQHPELPEETKNKIQLLSSDYKSALRQVKPIKKDLARAFTLALGSTFVFAGGLFGEIVASKALDAKVKKDWVEQKTIVENYKSTDEFNNQKSQYLIEIKDAYDSKRISKETYTSLTEHASSDAYVVDVMKTHNKETYERYLDQAEPTIIAKRFGDVGLTCAWIVGAGVDLLCLGFAIYSTGCCVYEIKNLKYSRNHYTGEYGDYNYHFDSRKKEIEEELERE